MASPVEPARRTRPPVLQALWEVLSRHPRVVLVYAMVAALWALGTARSDAFGTLGNVFNIGQQSTILGLAAIGQFLVILSGGIDLSVGSVSKLSAMVGASIMNGDNAMILPAVIVCCLIGAAVGTFNGVLINRLGVAPFIATFAAFYIVRGLAFTFSTNATGRVAPAWVHLYTARLGVIPMIVIVMGLVIILYGVFLQRTSLGRHIYALGGDEQVARWAAVKTTRVRLFVYINSGVLAALSGLYNMSRMGVGDPRAGEGLELDSITAVVVGGVNLFGGEGSIVGVLGGVILLGSINNMLDLLQVPTTFQQLIKGAIIIAAVALYKQRRAH